MEEPQLTGDEAYDDPVSSKPRKVIDERTHDF